MKIHELNPNQQQPQQQVQIDLSTSKPILCEKCGYDTFISGVKARKISKLLTGSPQDMILPIDVLLCGDCGTVIQELLPEQIKELYRMDNAKKEN